MGVLTKEWLLHIPQCWALLADCTIVWAWNEITSQQALIVDCECDHKQVSQKVVTVSVNNSVARSIVDFMQPIILKSS